MYKNDFKYAKRSLRTIKNIRIIENFIFSKYFYCHQHCGPWYLKTGLLSAQNKNAGESNGCSILCINTFLWEIKVLNLRVVCHGVNIPIPEAATSFQSQLIQVIINQSRKIFCLFFFSFGRFSFCSQVNAVIFIFL